MASPEVIGISSGTAMGLIIAMFTGFGSSIFTLSLGGLLVDAFKLTPGLRLADAQLCYGAQSGDVFVTAVDQNNEQQFIVIAKTATLDKW